MENEGGSATVIPNCKGIMGWIKGHKFNTNDDTGYGHTTDWCQRCGYKP